MSTNVTVRDVYIVGAVISTDYLNVITNILPATFNGRILEFYGMNVTTFVNGIPKRDFIAKITFIVDSTNDLLLMTVLDTLALNIKPSTILTTSSQEVQDQKGTII